jgi:peptidoglycan hydrolase CwlO-like protein
MEPSKNPSSGSEPTSSHQREDELNFEQEFEEAEVLLQSLKERYSQIQIAQQHRTELGERLHQLQAELHQVKAQIEAVEIELESRLFTWSSRQEIFWQFLRFAGLGFLAGLLLKACTS